MFPAAIIIYWNTLKLGEAVFTRKNAGLDSPGRIPGPRLAARMQQVEAGDQVVLSFRGSVSQFAALVEVDRALEGMVRLALVQSDLGASAHAAGVRGSSRS